MAWVDSNILLLEKEDLGKQTFLQRSRAFFKMSADVKALAASGHLRNFEMVAVLVGGAVNSDGALFSVVESEGAANVSPFLISGRRSSSCLPVFQLVGIPYHLQYLCWAPSQPCVVRRPSRFLRLVY